MAGEIAIVSAVKLGVESTKLGAENLTTAGGRAQALDAKQSQALDKTIERHLNDLCRGKGDLTQAFTKELESYVTGHPGLTKSTMTPEQKAEVFSNVANKKVDELMQDLAANGLVAKGKKTPLTSEQMSQVKEALPGIVANRFEKHRDHGKGADAAALRIDSKSFHDDLKKAVAAHLAEAKPVTPDAKPAAPTTAAAAPDPQGGAWGAVGKAAASIIEANKELKTLLADKVVGHIRGRKVDGSDAGYSTEVLKSLSREDQAALNKSYAISLLFDKEGKVTADTTNRYLSFKKSHPDAGPFPTLTFKEEDGRVIANQASGDLSAQNVRAFTAQLTEIVGKLNVARSAETVANISVQDFAAFENKIEHPEVLRAPGIEFVTREQKFDSTPSTVTPPLAPVDAAASLASAISAKK